MARTPDEIGTSIDDQLNAGLTPLGVVLSASQVAEWKLWKDTMVNADYTFEVIMDAFQSDIQTYVDTQKLGSLSWYAAISLAFQYGDTLLISSEGILYYATIDATKQIIQLASVKEDEDAITGVVTLVIKVAKIVTGVTTPLSSAELLGFSDYMKNMKIVGTHLQLVSQPADTIKYTIDVIYNPEVPQTTVAANIDAALDNFRTQRGFDPIIYKSAFEAAVLSAAGVVAVGVTLLTGTPDGGSPSNITLGYELAAGYFNYDNTSSKTLTPQ